MTTDQQTQNMQPMPDNARCVFKGKIFSIYQWEQVLFDGSRTIFEKAVRADSAGVLAVTQGGKILLSKQEQPGMRPFLSLLGGVVDPGESAIDTAKRELFEETGYVPNTIEPWFSVEPFSKIDWKISLFIARGCTKVSQPKLEPGEKISTNEIDFAEFLSTVFKPEFRDAEVTNQVARMLLQPDGKTQLQQLLQVY